ncbi:glycosyltransferase [Aerolutibacter ruishenii]|nr:glycosyltransferase [Lysobacter ruishenii]
MSCGRMLFHRDFRGYTGGHGKVWDYFNHALALGWDAQVYLTADSLCDASNPWMETPERIVRAWQPGEADIVFLAGMDWQALPAGSDSSPGAPCVINLVQHVRHARPDPDLPLRDFLRRRAWRICVSTAVADAILATGEVNGPVRTIPAGLALPAVAQASGSRSGVFIGALKQPALGAALQAALRERGIASELSDGWLPRPRFLAALAGARVAVLLPHATEGFFLPGLEAMALGCPVVMPPCGGSGEYARDGVNCLMPPADVPALVTAVERLLSDRDSQSLVAAGRATAARHSLAAEREAFGHLLDEVCTP